MSDLAALIDTHLAAYTEADAPRRAALVHRIWAASGQLRSDSSMGLSNMGPTQ